MKRFFLLFLTICHFNIVGQSLNDLSFGSGDALDIITWNLEWFPKNGQATLDSLTTAIIALDVDIIALQEISNTNEFNSLVSQLSGYSGHYTGTFLRLGFIYKSSLSINSTYTIFSNDTYNFASRAPSVMDINFNNENFIIINTHFKCCGNGVLDLSNSADEETRRYNAMNMLKQYIDQNHSNDNVIVLGDFNDVLTDAVNNNVFQQVLDDNSNYVFADMSIASGSSSHWSYPNWPSHLDHILITNELFDELNNGIVETIIIDNYFSGGFSQYDAIISDHRPVALSLGFVISGCMDPIAINYNSNANTDDGSCIYDQKTYIADNNFEQALINFGYDNVLDDSVLTSSISSVNALVLAGLNIVDLTGIEDFSALTYLDCSQNQITSLDLGQNTFLSFLNCSQNQLPSLDLSNNLGLNLLWCWGNQLYDLDISSNVNLTDLWCSYNQLISLDVRNGNNTNFSSFYASNNTNLNCINVDDPVWSTANWSLGIDAGTSFSNDCNAILGCTDSTASNYNNNATVDDGSCIFPSACVLAPTGTNISDIIDNRVTVNWDNMNSASCIVEKYRIKYRVVGSPTWMQKTITGSNSCNATLNTNSKRIFGLTPSTNYEYYMKAWYCSGTVSSWSDLKTFSTLSSCSNINNLSVTTPTTTKARFSWNLPTSSYSFCRIKARVDTVNATWFNVGGIGVSYPISTKDKNGLAPGQNYRAQARTWCSPNGGPYKSNTWSPLIYWMQPTSARIVDGTEIANLDIFPNPSKDVFNITFTSMNIQNLKIKVLNLVGEEIFVEELVQFVGEYTKKINLEKYAKAVYFLEIETDDGIINKKLILQ